MTIASKIFILLNILIASTAFTQTDSTSHKKRKNSSRMVTKDVTFQVVEDGFTINELERFDQYVTRHRKRIPGVHGLVKVAFTGEKDGSIKNVKIYKKLNVAADAEAVRLVKAFGKWKPNTTDGEPTSSRLTVPITF
jgi:hypothetical protein